MWTALPLPLCSRVYVLHDLESSISSLVALCCASVAMAPSPPNQNQCAIQTVLEHGAASHFPRLCLNPYINLGLFT